MIASARTELLQLGILAGMFVGSALLWPIAPDALPVHFDLNGDVDRVGGKVEGLFALPAVALGLYLVLRYLPRLDPARANYPTFAGAYSTIRVAALVMLALVDLATLLPIVGIAVDQAVMIRLIVGGMLVVLGTVMGKIRPNWFVGIRTPWTLASKESWVRTHRVGGWVFILSGLVFVATAPLAAGPAIAISFGVFALGIVWVIVYSYRVWQEDPVRYPAISTRPAPE